MSNTIRAERATIQLGDIPIKVYRLPDGSYRLSGRNITEAIKEPANSIIRSMKVGALEALPNAGSERYRISAGKEGSPFTPVALEDAITYWGIRGQSGNARAIAILTACAIEAIERRADNAFGVERSESERNQLLALRVDRISARFAWTDIIKQDQEHRGIYLTDLGDREFASITRLVNRRLFGVPHFECNRDNMTQEQQLDITAFERMLKRKFRPGCDIQSLIYDCLDFYESVEH